LINGKKIKLRPFEREDLESCKHWINDPEIARDVLRVLPVSSYEHIQWYERIIVDRSRVTFAIETTEEKNYIGNIGLVDIDWIHRKGKLWMYLGREYWNKGYGKEAATLFLKYVFHRLNLNKIYLDVGDFNHRAIKLYESVNFKKEGLLRQDLYTEGRYVDVIRMSLLRSEIDEP
jgi:UDP-4-amino-4,6-dideoxy-N-acetyl-beta-L-altrosamine N-acetyltransferase